MSNGPVKLLADQSSTRRNYEVKGSALERYVIRLGKPS
jgi:hypothetical protein